MFLFFQKPFVEMGKVENAELIQKLKATLEARPKHVLEAVAKRKLSDRASYYGSEITNFLESELGRQTSEVMGGSFRILLGEKVIQCGKVKIMDMTRGAVVWDADGLVTGKGIPLTAYDFVQRAIRLGIADPFLVMLECVIHFLK
jgi:hypothetical protein